MQASLLSGCGSCTTAGCGSQILFQVRSSTNTFPDGSYEATLTVDSASNACTFEIKDGALVSTTAKCDGLLSVSFDSNKLTLAFAGTGEQLVLSLRINDKLALEEITKPTLTEVRPNGPSCPPVCKQGVANLTLTP